MRLQKINRESEQCLHSILGLTFDSPATEKVTPTVENWSICHLPASCILMCSFLFVFIRL